MLRRLALVVLAGACRPNASAPVASPPEAPPAATPTAAPDHLYRGQPDPERDGEWAYDADHLSFVMKR